ncbi:MAG: RsmE family RNA methyltransferase [Elusimicrobiota bacterium]
MPQFLLSPEDISGKTFSLRGPEAFHVTRVLRRREGSTIELFDGRGGRYTGVIRAIHPDGSVSGEITGTAHVPQKEYPVTINLFLSLLKPSHWEWALEKCTEIGVARFVPVITPRTVMQMREAGETKRARWNKIMAAAAKQSRRGELPQLGETVHFRDAILQASKSGLTLLAWEKHAGATTYAGLREVLREAKSSHKTGLTVNLFIGPEGGFSDEEVEIAEYDGASFFSLGPSTLRSETAAVAACSIIFYELGAL